MKSDDHDARSRFSCGVSPGCEGVWCVEARVSRSGVSVVRKFEPGQPNRSTVSRPASRVGNVVCYAVLSMRETWLRDGSGLPVFLNRDSQRSPANTVTRGSSEDRVSREDRRVDVALLQEAIRHILGSCSTT